MASISTPMFIISNKEMILAAAEAGILGTMPSLNLRSHAEFRETLSWLRARTDRPFGINLTITSTGIDRCFGGEGDCVLAGDPCTDTGECCKEPYPDIECTGGVCCLADLHPCAFSDFCCFGVCAPDDNGDLVCCPGGGCVEAGGACTADADCCAGCCNDATMTCTDDPNICGTCTLGQLGDVCLDDGDCCNSPPEGPVRCIYSGEFGHCQLQ